MSLRPIASIRLWVSLALLLVLAACGSHRAPPKEPAHLSPEVCLAELNRLNVQYQTSEAPSGPCPVYDAVRVSATGAKWSRPALTSCDLALAIDHWTHEVVAPAAQKYFASDVKQINHMGTWSCRGQPNGEWSEHAKGNAIDVAGFTLMNGAAVNVEKDWKSSGAKADFLRAVAKGACRYFNEVLTPQTNYDHRNHLHLDIGPWKKCDA